MPATPNQITRNEASAGPILSTNTSRVVSHKVRRVLPVWVKPVRHDTATLRGYLKSSRHETDWIWGVEVGNSICLGSTCNAQASDLRASSSRPLPISQC